MNEQKDSVRYKMRDGSINTDERNDSNDKLPEKMKVGDYSVVLTPEECYNSNSKKDEPTPATILRDTATTVENKDADYGSAIEKGAVIKRVLATDDVHLREGDGHTYVRLGNHTVSSVQEQRLDGIFTRLLDKVSRLYNLSFTVADGTVDESVTETATDLIGYLAHLSVDGFTNEDTQ